MEAGGHTLPLFEPDETHLGGDTQSCQLAVCVYVCVCMRVFKSVCMRVRVCVCGSRWFDSNCATTIIASVYDSASCRS